MLIIHFYADMKINTVKTSLSTLQRIPRGRSSENNNSYFVFLYTLEFWWLSKHCMSHYKHMSFLDDYNNLVAIP